MLDLIKAAGLPRPQVNAWVRVGERRLEADFLFADRRLVIEADGERFHGNRIGRENDADRHALLEEAGYRVMRVIWKQVDSAPERTAARLRQFFFST